MAGLLIANGSGPLQGMAPKVTLSVAVGLGPEGTTGNSVRVADAIQWCRVSQRSDIISLSLGGHLKPHLNKPLGQSQVLFKMPWIMGSSS